MPFINIPLLIHFLKNFLYLFFMVFICGADKFIIGCIHHIPDRFYLCSNLVHIFLGRHPSFSCLLLNLLSMLISTCLKKYIISLGSFISGNAVCQNNFVGIPNMGLSRCISNGCCNIIRFFASFTHKFSSLKNRLFLVYPVKYGSSIFFHELYYWKI